MNDWLMWKAIVCRNFRNCKLILCLYEETVSIHKAVILGIYIELHEVCLNQNLPFRSFAFLC